MSVRSMSSPSRVFMAVCAVALAAGVVWGSSDQAKRGQLSAMQNKFPSAARQAAFCTNCARLSVHICSIPGYGCLGCNILTDAFNASGFFDPDFYIKNHGTLPSNPGTLTVQWYDLAQKANVTRTVAVPAIPAGGEDFVTIATAGMLFLVSEGVTLTLDYSDAAGPRHKVRKATKCPDM